MTTSELDALGRQMLADSEAAKRIGEARRRPPTWPDELRPLVLSAADERLANRQVERILKAGRDHSLSRPEAVRLLTTIKECRDAISAAEQKT